MQRFRAQAGEGVLTGTAEATLEGKRAFKVDARATAFDPGRFADIPHGRLDGTVSASGALSPGLDVSAALTLARGSLYAEKPISGTARAHVTARGADLAGATARDVSIDLRFGTATIALSGAFGTPADRLAFDFDIPRVADWGALLARYAKVTLPEELQGDVHARGTVSGDPRSPGLTIDAQGKALQWGPDVRVQTVTASASMAAGFDARGRVALDARPLKVTIAAEGVKTAGDAGTDAAFHGRRNARAAHGDAGCNGRRHRPRRGGHRQRTAIRQRRRRDRQRMVGHARQARQPRRYPHSP